MNLNSLRKLQRWVILFVAIAGLIWLLDRIGFAQIADSFQRMGLLGAAAIFSLGLAEAVFDGLALHHAALCRVSYWKALVINQSGAFLNMVAPVEAGEVLKATLLTRHTQGGASTAILVWNMAARLSKSSLILIATTLALLFLPSLRHQSAVCWGFAVLNVGGYMLLALIFRRGGVSRVMQMLTRLPFSFLKGDSAKKVLTHIQDAERKTAQFRHEHPGRYAAMLALQSCARTTGLLTIGLALRFMSNEQSFLLSLLIFAAIELAGYVIALLPTRIGTLEGSAFLVFGFLGLPGGMGTILQLFLRLKQLIVTGSLLLIGLLIAKDPWHRK